MPLMKGQFLKITLNYNASSQIVTYTHASTSIALSTPTITGTTNPIMISSGNTNNPNASCWGTADRTQGFACGIASATEPTSGTSTSHTILSNCRLDAELYTMNPTFEDQYLSLMPTRTVRYTDVYQYLISGQSGSFNALVTNGIIAPKTVIVLPYLAKAGNTGLTSVPVWQSPFTSEPGTTSPFCSISGFNVQVSGINIFSQNQNYVTMIMSNF